MVVLCKWRLHIISGGRNIHSKAFRWNSCIKKFTKVKVQALVEELTASGRRRWVAAFSLRAGTVQLCGKFEVNNVSWISVSGNWKSRHCLRKWTSCQWRWLPSRKLYSAIHLIWHPQSVFSPKMKKELSGHRSDSDDDMIAVVDHFSTHWLQQRRAPYTPWPNV